MRLWRVRRELHPTVRLRFAFLFGSRPSRRCSLAPRTRPFRHFCTAIHCFGLRDTARCTPIPCPTRAFRDSDCSSGFPARTRSLDALTLPTFLLASLSYGCNARPMADGKLHHLPASSLPRTASACGAAASPTTRSTATRTRTGRAVRPRSPARTTSPPLASPARTSEGLRPAPATCARRASGRAQGGGRSRTRVRVLFGGSALMSGCGYRWCVDVSGGKRTLERRVRHRIALCRCVSHWSSRGRSNGAMMLACRTLRYGVCRSCPLSLSPPSLYLCGTVRHDTKSTLVFHL